MRLTVCASLLSLTLAAARAQEAIGHLDPDAAGPAQRIWSAAPRELEETWFRRSLELPAPPKSARLAVSCDNECTVFVNGQRVAANDSHAKLTVAAVDNLRAGANVIAVHAKNTGGPAALALWLTWVDAKGGAHDLVSDKEWRVAAAAAAGWEALAFDDSKWQLATEFGATAFGRTVYGGTPAEIVLMSRYEDEAAAIEKAVKALRTAPDATAALAALDAIERAVMRARATAWEKRDGADKKK